LLEVDVLGEAFPQVKHLHHDEAQAIGERPGVVLVLEQEGRGIGEACGLGPFDPGLPMTPFDAPFDRWLTRQLMRTIGWLVPNQIPRREMS
jgi:hypothetical protein